MDLNGIGLDMGLVAAIIALTEIVKKQIPEKLIKWVVFLPLLLGVGAAFVVTSPLAWQGLVGNALKLGAISAYLWKSGRALGL